MLFLLIRNQTSIDDTVLDRNVCVVDVELRSIFVTNDSWYERFVRHVVRTCVVLIENVLISLIALVEISSHSFIHSSIGTLVWIESIAAEVLLLLLHIPGMLILLILIDVLINWAGIYHPLQVWFFFWTREITALLDIMARIERIEILFFILLHHSS